MSKTIIIISAFLMISFNEVRITVNEHIRKRVEDINSGILVGIDGDILYCTRLLPDFYIRRLFEPAWSNERNIREFLDQLSRAGESGLIPGDYHYDVLSDLSKKARGPEEKAELDLLLTDAFLLYGSHILNGKVNPETIDSEWKAVRREGNMIDILEKAISYKNVSGSLIELEPAAPAYHGLKNALTTYREVEDRGGWAPIPDGPTLKPGMQDSIRVPLLINRLTATGDLNFEPVDHVTYSESIAFSARKFQNRNGLEEDGNLGKITTGMMNVSVEDRISEILVNMERYRWISRDLGERFIFVNIAGFQMQVYEGDQIVLQEKVIVGKPFRKTPVFSAKMTYVVLNPSWTIPPTILFNDILPEVKKNVGYLASKNIRVFRGYGNDALEIDPNAINWSELTMNNFPYTLRQDPGPTNALGLIKFMFPNKYNVYIHDTPSKELFNRPERTFSSGCIRLKNPMSLFEYVMKDRTDYNPAKAAGILKEGKEHTILLSQPINVHIQYLTCWAIGDEVHFRKDIYQRDPDVLKALNEPAPNL